MKGVETKDGRGHKDNFLHTMQVLDSVAEKSDKEWLRWAALFHDIAKPVTKQYDQQHGWTFYNHNFVGKNDTRHLQTDEASDEREDEICAETCGAAYAPDSVG